MILPLLAAMASWGLCWVAYQRFKDPLYPPVLQAGVWATVISAFALFGRDARSLSPLLWFILVSGVAGFLLGANWGVERKTASKDGIIWGTVDSPRKRVTRLIVIFLPILGLPFFIQRGSLLASMGPTHSFLINIRYQQTVNGGDYGLSAYLVPLAFFAVAIQVMEKPIRSKSIFWVSLAVGLTYAVFETGRTFVMQMTALLVGIPLIQRRIKPLPALLSITAATALLFGLVGLALGKGGSFDQSLGDNFQGILSSFGEYGLGGVTAFNHRLAHGSEWSCGSHVFRSLIALTNKLGFQFQVQPLIQPFVSHPYESNVYTVYSEYFMDFGLFGALLIQPILGAFHGCLYRRANQGESYFVFLYALFLFPLMMQFFEDQYMSLLSIWVQYALLGWIYFKWLAPARTEEESRL